MKKKNNNYVITNKTELFNDFPLHPSLGNLEHPGYLGCPKFPSHDSSSKNQIFCETSNKQFFANTVNLFKKLI